jgi:hypothetical protein
VRPYSARPMNKHISNKKKRDNMVLDYKQSLEELYTAVITLYHGHFH